MDRRAFLKAVVAVPLAAVALPLQAHQQTCLYYRGRRIVIDVECAANAIYYFERDMVMTVIPWAEHHGA